MVKDKIPIERSFETALIDYFQSYLSEGWRVDLGNIIAPSGSTYLISQLPLKPGMPSRSPYDCDHFTEQNLLDEQEDAVRFSKLVEMAEVWDILNVSEKL